MRRKLAVLLVIALLIGISGCSKKEEPASVAEVPPAKQDVVTRSGVANAVGSLGYKSGWTVSGKKLYQCKDGHRGRRKCGVYRGFVRCAKR